MKRVEIRLPDTQYDHLEAFAKSHDISISACIRHILFPPPSLDSWAVFPHPNLDDWAVATRDIPYTKKEETDGYTD